MQQFINVFFVQLSLFVYIAAGIICRKANIITKSNQNNISKLITDIFMPCLAFKAFMSDISAEQWQQGIGIILISTFAHTLAYIVGLIFYKNYEFKQKSILKYSTLINNAGFAGLLVAQMMYGDIGIFYSSMFLIPVRIFMWSLGLSNFYNTNLKSILKTIVTNPNNIACALGVIRAIAAIPIPSFLSTPITGIGNCVTPISMILAGAIIADMPLKSLLSKTALYSSVIRLVLIPLICFVALIFYNGDSVAKEVAILLICMPAGSTAVTLASRYNADVNLASKVVLQSTILSLITVPIIYTLFVSII